MFAGAHRAERKCRSVQSDMGPSEHAGLAQSLLTPAPAHIEPGSEWLRSRLRVRREQRIGLQNGPRGPPARQILQTRRSEHISLERHAVDDLRFSQLALIDLDA